MTRATPATPRTAVEALAEALHVRHPSDSFVVEYGPFDPNGQSTSLRHCKPRDHMDTAQALADTLAAAGYRIEAASPAADGLREALARLVRLAELGWTGPGPDWTYAVEQGRAALAAPPRPHDEGGTE